MAELPTIERFLNVAGRPVVIEESGPDSPSPLTRHLAAAAPWLKVRASSSGEQRVLSLHGSNPHGAIRFLGEFERRMIEPLVLTLRALATGYVDLDTPATPAFLQDLQRDVHLRLVVSVSCPYCPAAAAVALRLACVSSRVYVDVIRADFPGAPDVRAVPTLFDGESIVASGPMQEMRLVELLLRVPR